MEVKGKIESIKTKDDVKTKLGFKKMFWVIINGTTYSGWGDCPYKEGEEVTVEYDINKREVTDAETGETKEMTYYNIKQPSKAEQSITKSINPLIEVLAQNKVNFTLSEKLQHPNGKDYSMKEYSASHTVNMKQLTEAEGIKMFQLLQGIIDKKKELDVKAEKDKFKSSSPF